MVIVKKIGSLQRFLPQSLGGSPDNIYNTFVKFHITRKKHLPKLVRKNRCRRIIEIGVYRENMGGRLIKAAMSNFPANQIEYYGFDVFEDINEGDEKIKTVLSEDEIRKKLGRLKCKIVLVKGNSMKTLPAKIDNLPQMDFIFMDGGHSYETVKSDWECSERLMHPRTIVVFDDVFNKIYPGPTKVVNAIDRKKYKVEILKGKICSLALVKKISQ